MCCLPQCEQDAAMDDTGRDLDERAARMMAAHPINQDLGLRMHRVSSGNFIASDFVPMAEIDEELRNGSFCSEVKQVAVLVLVMLVMLLATQLPFIDWGHVLQMIWVAR